MKIGDKQRRVYVQLRDPDKSESLHITVRGKTLDEIAAHLMRLGADDVTKEPADAKK